MLNLLVKAAEDGKLDPRETVAVRSLEGLWFRVLRFSLEGLGCLHAMGCLLALGNPRPLTPVRGQPNLQFKQLRHWLLKSCRHPAEVSRQRPPLRTGSATFL